MLRVELELRVQEVHVQVEFDGLSNEVEEEAGDQQCSAKTVGDEIDRLPDLRPIVVFRNYTGHEFHSGGNIRC